MSIRSLLTDIRKLTENHALGVMTRPSVVLNYRRYNREVLDKPLVMKSHPVGIEIELTNRCNLACTQCFRSLGLKPYKLGDMDVENYKKILAQFPYALNLSLNGFGEPLMYPHFFEIVEYTRKLRPWMKVGVYSNGMLLDEDKAHKLVECGLTEINISVDAADPDSYRRIRRGGKLDVLHDNIRRLVRVKRETGSRYPLFGLNYVMVNDNEGELVPFIDKAAEFGVDFVNCISWAAYDWGFKNKRTPDSYLRELEAGRKRLDEIGMRCKSFPTMSTRWADPAKPFDCAFFWGEEFRVTFNGDITLGCCTPFKETFTYGNVLEQPFTEIWNNPVYQRNRELAKINEPPTKTCASCDAFCKSFFVDRDEIGGAFISASTLAVHPKAAKGEGE